MQNPDINPLKINDEEQDVNTKHSADGIYKRKNPRPNASTLEKLYQKMVEEVSDYAILLLDTNGTILNWNPGVQNIKGYSESEIIGKNFRVFYTSDDRKNQLPEKLLDSALQNGRASQEGWRVKKDGSTFWGSIVITALHDNGRNVIGFSKVTRDLTERKKSEERMERYTSELQYQNELLRQSEERYHRMIAEVEDYAIILLDINGNILNWNKGAENIKGYKDTEILGKSFKQFYRLSDQQIQLPEQLLNEAVKNNKATHEGWRVRKDGTEFWGNIVITALHNEEGKITGFSKVTRDLTQKKHFEDLILLQNKQLEEYAYVASHDLQEPLRKIMLFSDLLEKNLDNKEIATQYLNKINVSSSRMTNLIKGVLQYSQTTENKSLMSAVDLNGIIKEIESDFDMLLQEKNGKIIYEKLPAVYGIQMQMHQLFSNLISNAIKFNDQIPHIYITATVEEVNGKSFAKIKISDNGVGFEPEYTDKIFKMFHRLHATATGTGIGLALCKRIVDGHGGTINALSNPGKGTIFEVLLPSNQM